jgi:hypothetical protein
VGNITLKIRRGSSINFLQPNVLQIIISISFTHWFKTNIGDWHGFGRAYAEPDTNPVFQTKKHNYEHKQLSISNTP